MKPADQLRALLAQLAKRAPEVYQQLTMPGAGFSAIPSEALEDPRHDFWSTRAAVDLIAECIIAIDEQGPDPDEEPEPPASVAAPKRTKWIDSFTAGTTPPEVITEYARRHCGSETHFPMTIVSQREWQAIAAAWNQGIDSHLEALTRSTLDDCTGEVRIHVEELATFCRRLQEYADEVANRCEQRRFSGSDEDAEAAEQLRSAIIDHIGIEEI